MANTNNIAVWFEIAANNFERAVNFYETILEVKLETIEMCGLRQGLFPHDDKAAVSGAVICGEGVKPSADGCVVYLHGGDDLSTVLSRVTEAGGEVVTPKTHLCEEVGYIAHFLDTEGNRIGLHSMK